MLRGVPLAAHTGGADTVQPRAVGLHLDDTGAMAAVQRIAAARLQPAAERAQSRGREARHRVEVDEVVLQPDPVGVDDLQPERVRLFPLERAGL